MDPLAEDYYDVSPYAYVMNNPLTYNDPTGMSTNDTIKSGGTLSEVVIVGKQIMPAVSGFWGNVSYFLFGRTYSTNAKIYDSDNNSIKDFLTTFNVDRFGKITGIAPIMGTPPDVGIGMIGGYRKLTQLAKGLRLQAHYLLEVRHLKRLLKSSRNAPAVLLTKEEHSILTKALRTEMPYGRMYTAQEIERAYKTVYKDKPEWLKIALDYLSE
ncbi:hypothetical protein SDC9_167212 [bioreactor metagenome]|uniref:RHS repeat-associated core domain-containing protein n=1 Tax=bioreactor metagenome TaxID=1076179 RepID=A0A645G1S2_9ZZZZ